MTSGLRNPSWRACADEALDLRAPLGDAPAALPLGPVASPAADAATRPVEVQAAATPAGPSERRPPEVEQQRSGEVARQLSSGVSGALSLGAPQRQRLRRPATPQFLAFRRFVKERQLVQRSQSSARMKVRAGAPPGPPPPRLFNGASLHAAGAAAVLDTSSPRHTSAQEHVLLPRLPTLPCALACVCTCANTRRR